MTDNDEFPTNLASQTIAFQTPKLDTNGMPGLSALPETAAAVVPSTSLDPPLLLDNVYIFIQDLVAKNSLAPWKLFIERPQNVIIFYQMDLHNMRELPRFSKAVRVENESAGSRWVKATVFLGERRMSEDLVKILLGRGVLENIGDLERILQHVDRFPLDRSFDTPLRGQGVDQGVNTMPIMFNNGSMTLFELQDQAGVQLPQPPVSISPVRPRGKRGRKKGWSMAASRAQTEPGTPGITGDQLHTSSSNRVTRSAHRPTVTYKQSPEPVSMMEMSQVTTAVQGTPISGSRRFHCNLCEKSYTAQHNLRLHQDKCHPTPGVAVPAKRPRGRGRFGRVRGRGRGRRGFRGRKRPVPPSGDVVVNGMEEGAQSGSEPHSAQAEEVSNQTLEAMGEEESPNKHRKHSCQYCDKGYTQRHNLTSHQKKCHPMEFAFGAGVGAVASSPAPVAAPSSTPASHVKRYSCEHCGRKFDRAQTLKFHLTRAHPQEEAQAVGGTKRGLEDGEGDEAEPTADRSYEYDFEGAT